MAGFSAKDLDNLEAGGKGYEQPQSLQRGNGTVNRKGDAWEPDSKRFHDQLPNSAGALCMSAARTLRPAAQEWRVSFMPYARSAR